MTRITPNSRNYALRIAQVYATKLPHLADDIRGAAMLGLTQAAKNFREGEGDFLCYSRIRIAGAIQDELRLHDPLSRDQRTAVKQGLAAEAELVGYDPKYHEPGAWDIDPGRGHDIETMLATLPRRLARAVRWHFLHGTKLDEVGRRLRVTESRACQLIGVAVRRLRRQFGPVLS